MPSWPVPEIAWKYDAFPGRRVATPMTRWRRGRDSNSRAPCVTPNSLRGRGEAPTGILRKKDTSARHAFTKALPARVVPSDQIHGPQERNQWLLNTMASKEPSDVRRRMAGSMAGKQTQAESCRWGINKTRVAGYLRRTCDWHGPSGSGYRSPRALTYLPLC